MKHRSGSSRSGAGYPNVPWPWCSPGAASVVIEDYAAVCLLRSVERFSSVRQHVAQIDPCVVRQRQVALQGTSRHQLVVLLHVGNTLAAILQLAHRSGVRAAFVARTSSPSRACRSARRAARPLAGWRRLPAPRLTEQGGACPPASTATPIRPARMRWFRWFMELSREKRCRKTRPGNTAPPTGVTA